MCYTKNVNNREKTIQRPHSFRRLLCEVHQDHSIRKPFLLSLQKALGRTVITFFTSFHYPATIDDSDAAMLEEVLLNTRVGKGISLVLNSPGGDGLAAERIINIIRSFSRNNFEVIIPHMAKSAATMISLGAKNVVMSDTSELGPIDPQVIIREGSSAKLIPAHCIIRSYKDLFEKAISTEKGRIEPYLQQLQSYNASEIERLTDMQKLSESIAINTLATGMLGGKDEEYIREKIKIFLVPDFTRSHGRPIHWRLAKKCGIIVKHVRNNSSLWKKIWEIYIRTDYFVTHKASKVIESVTDSYVAGVPK